MDPASEVHNQTSAVVELTQAEYSRHRGVTPKAISKAIDRGRIPQSAVRRDGKSVLIDAAAADLALGASRSRINTAENLADSAAAAAAAADAKNPAGPGLTRARTQQAVYDARLKELEYERQIAKLVRVEDVTRAMERCAEVLARDLSMLSARADDLVAAAARGGVIATRKLLRQLEFDVRTRMAANMKLLADSDPEHEHASIESSGSDKLAEAN